MKSYNNKTLFTHKNISKKEGPSRTEIFVFGDKSALDIAIKNSDKAVKYSIQDVNDKFMEGLKQGATLDRYTILEPNSNKFYSRRKLGDIYNYQPVKDYMIEHKLKPYEDQINEINENIETLSKGLTETEIKQSIELELLEEEKLKSILTRDNIISTGITDPTKYFNKYIKNQNQIISINDRFTLYDSYAINKLKEKKIGVSSLNIKEYIRDDRKLGIHENHMMYFKIDEFMGPPNMIPTQGEGIRRHENAGSPLPLTFYDNSPIRKYLTSIATPLKKENDGIIKDNGGEYVINVEKATTIDKLRPIADMYNGEEITIGHTIGRDRPRGKGK